MSEHTQNNQTLVIGLVVVAVLLAALVGVLVWQQSNAVPPVSTPAASTTPAEGAADGTTDGTTGMPPATDAAATAVDPASATAVAEGTEPEDFVKGYYEACDADDWEAAFEMLPVAKQEGNSAAAMKEQVTSYGIESWEITDATVEGDTAIITVEQVTGAYGTFVNQWTFTQVDGAWFVANKAVTGMK